MTNSMDHIEECLRDLRKASSAYTAQLIKVEDLETRQVEANYYLKRKLDTLNMAQRHLAEAVSLARGEAPVDSEWHKLVTGEIPVLGDVAPDLSHMPNRNEASRQLSSVSNLKVMKR